MQGSTLDMVRVNHNHLLSCLFEHERISSGCIEYYNDRGYSLMLLAGLKAQSTQRGPTTFVSLSSQITYQKNGELLLLKVLQSFQQVHILIPGCLLR